MGFLLTYEREWVLAAEVSVDPERAPHCAGASKMDLDLKNASRNEPHPYRFSKGSSQNAMLQQKSFSPSQNIKTYNF